MLSKSQYIRGLQCPKSLWLYKHKPELRSVPDASQEALFEAGVQVGDLAKRLFPGGVEIAFDPENFDGMIRKTKERIDAGMEVIYEAAFKERGIFAMADILVRTGEGWGMYEVKSSTSVKSYHLEDAAVQWYALSAAIDLKRAYVVHIDSGYVREGELEPDRLFAIRDITDEVLIRLEAIPARVSELEAILSAEMPDVEIGPHCNDPFDCDFRHLCWDHVPSPSVFDLYRMRGSQKFALYRRGILSYDEINQNDVPLNRIQRLQVQSHLNGDTIVDQEIIKEFLETVEYPIHFFDFETFQEAIPRFDRQRPYQQIPFQYSLHILHADGTLEHREFLGDEHSDPRPDMIGRMLRDIMPIGSIIAYNQSFEIGRIRELAAFAPEHEEELLALTERFVDLIVPFRRLGYYHPDFNGSFSIKSVLPAMFPNDEELDYRKLGTVQNGGDAMETFARLHRLKDPSKREAIRKDLLAYCRLDTLAMVRILERLREMVEEGA